MSQTLEQALNHAYQTRWQHTRDGGKCLLSQAKIALYALHTENLLSNISMDSPLHVVTEQHVRKAIQHWYSLGISPATINKRLSCLSVMGVKVDGCKQPKSRALKWYLTAEEEAKALQYLTSGSATPVMRQLATLIAWTTVTGLRIEETLRLTHWEFPDGNYGMVMVPGTKTASSQAVLPLSSAAKHIAAMTFIRATSQDQKFLTATYDQLEAAWNALRTLMKWQGNGVTMKALRRSAARHLHIDCNMPLDMVRQYLRHESINTTLEYLRLTGGYGTEEMRRYLK